MPRSWKPDTFPAGDTIGEALVNHSLADVEILSALMAEKWDDAIEILPELRTKFADDPDRMRDCAVAHCCSAENAQCCHDDGSAELGGLCSDRRIEEVHCIIAHSYP